MKTFIKLLLLTMSTSAIAAQVTTPNTFVAGQSAVAAEVNANFTALSDAINDNDTRITGNTATVSGFTDKINTNTANVANNSKFIAANASVGVNNTNAINNNTAGISGNGQLIGKNTASINANKSRIDTVVANDSGYATTINNNTNAITTNSSNIDVNTSNVSINTMATDINAAGITNNTASIQELQIANTTPGTLKAFDGNGVEIGTVISMNIGNPTKASSISNLTVNSSITVITSKGYIRPNINMLNGSFINNYATIKRQYYKTTNCTGQAYANTMNGLVLTLSARGTGEQILQYTPAYMAPTSFRPSSSKYGNNCTTTSLQTSYYTNLYPNRASITGVANPSSGNLAGTTRIAVPITLRIK